MKIENKYDSELGQWFSDANLNLAGEIKLEVNIWTAKLG